MHIFLSLIKFFFNLIYNEIIFKTLIWLNLLQDAHCTYVRIFEQKTVPLKK